MIRRLLIASLLVFTVRAEDPAPETDTLSPVQVRQLLRDASALYEEHADDSDAADPEALTEAARAFARAAREGDPGEVHLDAVRLAEAMAWMRAGQPEQALEAFDRIQGFSETHDRARHRFLRGNAHLAAGEAALSREDFETAKSQMGEAVESFISSLMEDPQAEAAKQNLEIARRRLRWVEENEPPPAEEDTDPDDQDEEPDDTPQPEIPPKPEPGDEEEDDPDDDPAPTEAEGEDEGEESETDPADEDETDGEADADTGDPAAQEDVDGDPVAEDLDDLDLEDAVQTLDALLEQERRLREEIIRNRHHRSIPVEKDW